MTFHLRPRGEGVWQIVLDFGRDGKGKRVQKYVTFHGTETKANKEGRRLLSQAEAGNLVAKDRVTVQQFLELWLEKYAARHCRPTTLENYSSHIRKHIIPQLGRLKLAKLSTLDLEDYYADRLQRGRIDGKGGLAPQSVLHHHRVLHEAFEYAIKWNYLTRNPAEHATPPVVEAEEPKVLDEEEAFVVIQAARGTRYYLPVLLAVFMGLRRGEVLGLRWSAIDWGKKQLRVQETYIRLSSGSEFSATKTKRSKRPVSMPEFLIDALLEEKAGQTQRKLDYPDAYQEHDLVCCRPDGAPWPPNAFSHRFSDWIARVPVTQVTFHELRHSHISQMVEAGENIKAISSRVGHASASFTLDRYAHVLDGADAGIASRLNERIQKRLTLEGSSGGQNGKTGGQHGSGPAVNGSQPAGSEGEWRADGGQAKKKPPRGGCKIVRSYARK